MKHLYIFENKQSSSQCGLGTYMNEIVMLISQWTDVNLCFIMFQTEAKKCMNCSCKGVDYILLPKVLSETFASLIPNLELRFEVHQKLVH